MMMDMFRSDSDWDTSSDSGSSDDQEETKFFFGGQASSILSSLQETIGKIDEFLSFERMFMLGDVVRSAKDLAGGQVGRVVGIDMLVDLEKNGHGKVIKDVNTRKISKIQNILSGDFVVCGPWIGRVEKTIDRVTVVFDDGAKSVITAMDENRLLPISSNVLEDDAKYSYYPGQRVKVRVSSTSKPASWLCGTWKDDQVEGTVSYVESGLAHVEWLASALTGCENTSFPTPQRLQDANNLTVLSCFPHANWQLGDWCMFSVDVSEDVTMGKIFEREFNGGIFVIVKITTKVDVLWQDGSRSMGLGSKALLPVNGVNDHEFWPEEFVKEKGPSCDSDDDDDVDDEHGQRWGVVMAVDSKEQTVKVCWKQANLDAGQELEEETMSAYGLIEHPDYSFSFGDIVFRLGKNKFDAQADRERGNLEISMGEVDALKVKDSQDVYSSCIGCVTGFFDGAVEIRWANYSTTKVSPNEIFRVDKYEGSVPRAMTYEENVKESLSQELVEPNKNSWNFEKNHSWKSGASALSLVAIGFLSSIARSIFGSTSLSEDDNESMIFHEKKEQEIDESEKFNETTLTWENEEIIEDEDFAFSKIGENNGRFKQFDMVSNCQDHHLLGPGKGLEISQMRRGWLKKLHQEWSILEKNLPETIYVRAIEERIELLRAVIIGAPGTPYHDGLFFFDIFLPPEYPLDPPTVHYISGGVRVNPNLYESGKVCLSLLNTWTGTGTEVWDPQSSTILQVLLSLQALVLNERPYFNEAGYDAQVGRAEGEKNSVSYNENAFLGTCKSMLHILHRPPKHFEKLVEEHFSRKARDIIMACKAYMEGAPMGCLNGEANENRTGSSTGFKIMLAKLFPKLVEAFTVKGIDCSHYMEPDK